MVIKEMERRAVVVDAWRDPDDLRPNKQAPHLSHSRVAKYLLCPEQYRLYYVENLYPRCPSANLAFGQAIHQALAAGLADGGKPEAVFAEIWARMRDTPLTYSTRDSWEKLQTGGTTMLRKFMAEERGKIGAIHAIEKPFQLDITSLDLPFVGIIDLVAEVERKRTVVDFKTAATAYEGHEVALADQLTAYQLAEPESVNSAFLVFVKTKEPRIDWYPTTRTPAQFTEYLAKVGFVGREIAAGHFYRRPGKWCSWCDYLPVCLGDRRRAEETLVQIK